MAPAVALERPPLPPDYGYTPPADIAPTTAPVPMAPPVAPGVVVPPNRYPMPAPPPDAVGPLATTPLPSGQRYAVDQARADIARDDAAAPPPAPPPGAPPAPGLAGLNVDQAATDLAAVGKRRPGGGAPTAAAAPDLERQAITKAVEANEAEAKATEAEGEAAAQAAEAKAKGYDKRAELARQQVRDREIFETAQAQARAKAVDVAEQAEAEVQGFKFHNRFENPSTGTKLAMIFGAFAAGAGGGAQGLEVFNQRVQKVIENDFAQQKATLDKGLTLARAKREGVRDFDSWVRDQRGALDHKEALATNAAADELDALALRGGAKVDQAKLKAAAQKLRADGANKQVAAEHGIIESETQRQHAKLLKAETARQYAEAEKARAEAATAGTSKIEIKGLESVDKRADAVKKNELIGTQRNAGPLLLLDRMTAMSGELDRAVKSGDKNAAILALDEGSRMISGAAPTKTSTHLLQSLQSAKDELESKWGYYSGNPGATSAFTGRLKSLIDEASEERRAQIKEIRDRYLREELGPGGLANTPAYKARVQAHAQGMFGGVKDAQGRPVFEEGGAQPGGGGRTYMPQDDQALAWANANPNDPRAAAIHQRQGR